jgi:hypothetical protein
MILRDMVAPLIYWQIWVCGFTGPAFFLSALFSFHTLPSEGPRALLLANSEILFGPVEALMRAKAAENRESLGRWRVFFSRFSATLGSGFSRKRVGRRITRDASDGCE